MTDPFKDSSIEKPDADTKSVGLAVPAPLSSAELEQKYRGIRHDSIEILWPTQFEDAEGHIEDLTPHDLAALKHWDVTVEEYYAVELELAG